MIKVFIPVLITLTLFYSLFSTSDELNKLTRIGIIEKTVNETNFTNQTTLKEDLPLILSATEFSVYSSLFESKWFKPDPNCPFKCTYSNDNSLYEKANVAIFSSRHFNYSEKYLIKKNPSRLNTFFAVESEANENLRTKFKGMPLDFFNLTISHRRDSSIWTPYDRFEPIDQENQNQDEIWTDKQVESKLKNKSKLLLQFVSHCDTHSKREKLSQVIHNHVNLTEYGTCIKKSCDKDCEAEEIDKHFFYLAFENSVCRDYITEKFWRIKQLIVPVVLKRSILKGIVEDEYFIAVDDYKSIDEFINHLKYLSTHLDEYKKYLRWTKKYKKTRAISTASCQLCELAHEKKQNIIPNIVEWWHKDCTCYESFSINVFYCKSYPLICKLRSLCINSNNYS